MSSTTPTRRSTLLLASSVICFFAAVAYGVLLPLLTASTGQIVYGVFFLVIGLLILAYRDQIGR